MLWSLIIGKDEAHTVDFSCQPWSDAALVTPRHAVRTQWNDAAIRKMCREKGKQIFKCTAHDTIRGRTIGMKERCILKTHRGKRKKGGHNVKDLPYAIEIAIGMKVMVTTNIETNLDIMNGAQGGIIDIILHPEEPPIDPNKAVVQLKYIPAYLLVKLSRTRATRLEGVGGTG